MEIPLGNILGYPNYLRPSDIVVNIYVVTIWDLKGVVVYIGSICSDIFYIINIIRV